MTGLRRSSEVAEVLEELRCDRLVALFGGIPDFMQPNPVMLLSGFRSLGASAVVVTREGDATLLLSPRWDAERGAASGVAVRATDDLAGAVGSALAGARRIAAAGLDAAGRRLRLAVEAVPEVVRADEPLLARTAAKAPEELARARRASEIATSGFERLLELVAPGVAEHELTAELDALMARAGADDNFMLLASGPQGSPIRQPTSRLLVAGDVLGVELSPSVDGQFVQICRTVTVGPASAGRVADHELLERAFAAGLAAIRPGVTVGAVAEAVDGPIVAAGFGDYCRPPYMRARGHGLGTSSVAPGALARGNEAVLEPGMLFVLHPNQQLPGSGYLLCGDTVLVTEDGAEVLGAGVRALAEVAA